MYSEMETHAEDSIAYTARSRAEEDMKHMLSYVGYMALDCRTASGVWKSKITLNN